MPQMAPLYWMFLYFMFIAIFMFFLSLNYFHKIEVISKRKSISSKMMLYNWKW